MNTHISLLSSYCNYYIFILRVFYKPGGLDSRDQSRSRSGFLDLSRPTFKNCRECPSYRDQLFFSSVKIFKIETFQSRLGCVEINRDCQDFWDLLILFDIYWEISTLSRLFEVLQDQKSWQIEKSCLRNVIKLTNSPSRSRQTVKICQKCHVSTNFSISIKTFGTGRWCRDKIEISQSRSRYLDCRD